MVNIHPLPHKRLAIHLEPDSAYYLSAVGGPNYSPQIESILGKSQIGFGVHV